MPALDTILPAVLAGGKSRRFGRDKLREPLAPGSLLIDASINALREVFGPRVVLVGDCAPDLRSRADGQIPDLVSGAGALGGIISALSAAHERGQTAVFILAGDLPRITPEIVRSILEAATRSPDAPAVVALADGLQPCIALYRAAALAPLREAANAGPRARPLTDLVQSMGAASVPIDPLCALNVNTPRDLDSLQR